MTYQASTPEEYLELIPEERKTAFTSLRNIILKNLPKGFEECISYGMLGYVVPHSIYPAGYHCNPKLPLPFINIASQKNFIALYHMGIYMHPELLEWFLAEFPKYSKSKLDMGKSCIRFKKMDDIPYDLIGELVQKISCEEYITIFEAQLKK